MQDLRLAQTGLERFERQKSLDPAMPSLRERRVAIVQEHIAAEKAHDISRTIATFHRPRYELAPFCSVSDGDQAVRDLLAGLFATFPDFEIEHVRLQHAGESVVVECVVAGTRHRPFASAAHRPANRGAASRKFRFRRRSADR